ncbi:MAG: indolepyruvate ferredoxin oxidoreductase subunit alpha [Coriobacteriia bacterium]|nr:indolepyruvate ferredoxin oxidoreductase subunit alpha [Coriobacteriia bacterium]
MSGNEAVARGAWEAGVVVGVGYPGTPSTEVLENLVGYEGVNCQWAPNEKVAAEVAAGVSVAGARVLVTMKHVGLNVAADPLFTQAYAGVGGGLVYLVADDPSMHSSQNEQDTRNYAAAAKVPILEPSDSAEALEFVKRAFEISEHYDVPVIVRTTTRISHSKSMVEVGEREERDIPEYHKDAGRFVMMPANARVRRVDLARRLNELETCVESCPENRVEMRGTELGVITSGVAYQYVREALPDVSVLKLGMTFPFPEALVGEFAAKVERLAVVEELDPYLMLRVKALGIEVMETGLPQIGEYSPGLVAAAFGAPEPELREPITDLPPRPPLMCPGCPHRGVFYALHRLKAVVTGDIGCYTLGALPPLQAVDTCICMGASMGMAHGMELIGSAEKPVVAVIGDSTFAHSGLTGLLNMVYNGSKGTVMILDNRTTAMTGHQGNPVSGVTLAGDPAPAVDLEALVRAMGVSSVRMVNPHDPGEVYHVLKEEVAAEHLSVIVAKAPCALLVREKADPFAVDEDACVKCGRCINLGCPAISKDPQTSRAVIDATICVGCGLCVKVCKSDAIVPSGAACDIGGRWS